MSTASDLSFVPKYRGSVKAALFFRSGGGKLAHPNKAIMYDIFDLPKLFSVYSGTEIMFYFRVKNCPLRDFSTYELVLGCTPGVSCQRTVLLACKWIYLLL